VPDGSKSMTEVDTVVGASPDRVFAELADGWAYAGWVVGATHVRGVDAEWPSPGAKIHHQVGVWPFVISDDTKSVDCVPGQRLVLEARAWPVGEATVDIRLDGQPGGTTRVTIREAPSAGPGRWLDNPALRWLLRRRNVETLKRLKDRVEKRPRPAVDSGPS
jgi:hypothetical protein